MLVVEFLFFVRRDEKFRDIIFSEQGTTKYSHDLHDGTPKFEVMLNDSDKTVCDDGNVNLNAHSIVALSPKELDSEMLLNPFEEQLHLPSISIKESDVLGCKIKVVRVVSERSVQFWGIIGDTPNFAPMNVYKNGYASFDTRVLSPPHESTLIAHREYSRKLLRVLTLSIAYTEKVDRYLSS